jgi:hypothetical protein
MYFTVGFVYLLIKKDNKMPTQDQVRFLCKSLGLTPYQTNTVVNNRAKYNAARMIKRGGIVMVPYREDNGGFRESAARVILGARADLLGPDYALAIDKRGFKIKPDGFRLSDYHFSATR